MSEAAVSTRQHVSWPTRLRLVAAVALVWALLYYVTDATVLPRGMDRPLLVLVGDGGTLAAIVVLLLLGVGAIIAKLVCGGRDGMRGVLAVGFALALWAWPSGTMDNWLEIRNPRIGPPSGAAYWPLLAEYAYWAVAVGVLLAIATWRRDRAKSAGGELNSRSIPKTQSASAALRDGITALVVTVAVAAVLVLILMGPRHAHTFRGQVYFAVAVGFALAVAAARRVSGARDVLWYLPAPLLVGMIGVLLAVAKPGLGPGYENIDIIPAWGLVRPLPIEMVSVGLIAMLLTLRTAARLSSEEERG